jgi:hypothetical protein
MNATGREWQKDVNEKQRINVKHDRHQRRSETDKEWLEDAPRNQQKDVRPDSRMHGCERGDRVLQRQVCFVRN